MKEWGEVEGRSLRKRPDKKYEMTASAAIQVVVEVKSRHRKEKAEKGAQDIKK